MSSTNVKSILTDAMLKAAAKTETPDTESAETKETPMNTSRKKLILKALLATAAAAAVTIIVVKLTSSDDEEDETQTDPQD